MHSEWMKCHSGAGPFRRESALWGAKYCRFNFVLGRRSVRLL